MLKQSYRLFRLAMLHSTQIKSKLGIVLFLEIISILCLYFLNKQYGLIYQGIQDYNISQIWQGVAYFSGIAGILVVVGGFLTYYTNKLAFSIRAGLTTHYLLNLKNLGKIENVEQRIQEDLKNFGERSCDFWLTVLRSIIKLPIFMGIIVTLTQWWIGLIILMTVIIGTLATKLLSKKLIELQAYQESNEAVFRTAVKQNKDVKVFFIKIHATFLKINKQIKKLSFLQSGLGQMFVLLPFIILLPLYISKVVTMGAFMQSVNALSKVIDSLTVLIDNRMMIVSISTCLTRMKTLESKE